MNAPSAWTRCAVWVVASACSTAAWPQPPTTEPPLKVDVWLAPASNEGQRPCADVPKEPGGWRLALSDVQVRGQPGNEGAALNGRSTPNGWRPLPATIESWAGRCVQLRQSETVVFQGEAVADQRSLPRDQPSAQLLVVRRHHALVPLYCPRGTCVP